MTTLANSLIEKQTLELFSTKNQWNRYLLQKAWVLYMIIMSLNSIMSIDGEAVTHACVMKWTHYDILGFK